MSEFQNSSISQTSTMLKRFKKNEILRDIFPVVRERLAWFTQDMVKGFILVSQNKYLHIFVDACNFPVSCLVKGNCIELNHECYICVSRTCEDNLNITFACNTCKKRKRDNSDGGNTEEGDGKKKKGPTDVEFANMLCESLKGNAVFVPNLNSWYFYNGIRWVSDRLGTHLRLQIDNLLIPRFTEPKTVRSLQCTCRRDSIVKECRAFLQDDEFTEKLDANPLLVGFENGIYDFGTETFRPSVAEDLVSFSTGCNFIKDFAGEKWDAMKKEVAEFFKDITLGDLEKCHMLMNILASAYNGTKRKQLFLLFEGSKCPYFGVPTLVIMARCSAPRPIFPTKKV